MPRYAAVVALSAILLMAACGGDDDAPDSSPSPSASAVATPKPTAAGDKETPSPDEPAVTPAPQAGDTTPTAPPVNPGGTPAVEPADADDFIAQFQGQPVDFHDCAYNPATALVNCANFGVFGINPPITGQDITCTLWEIDGKPVAIQCQSAEPLATRYHAIN
jgi:hypothetical protein